MKTKTHVITVSMSFPKTHPRAGQPTHFVDNITRGLFGENEAVDIEHDFFDFSEDAPNIPKLHTVRSNYAHWQKRIEEVQDGTAVLSLRVWSERPYMSQQVKVKDFTASDGIGVQLIQRVSSDEFLVNMTGNRVRIGISELAKNDGLSAEDLLNWFKDWKIYEVKAIIHFTGFRY